MGFEKMRSMLGRTSACLIPSLGVAVGLAAARPAWADGAGRDLSGYSGPGTVFTVSIAIDPVPGTGVVGLEDAPPGGWSVANISHSGGWDAQSQEVKWGPFFDPSIPATVTYDVTPLASAGAQCFVGTVSFDGNEEAVGGDPCVGGPVPTATGWGLTCLGLVLLAVGTALIRRRIVRPCGQSRE